MLDLNNLSIENIILLNSISVNIIDDFNGLSEQIFKATNQKISWLFNSVLSRNPNQSNLFLYCSYLVLIDSLLLKNRNISKIIVPSIGFKNVLSKYFLSNSINIEIIVNNNKSIIRKVKDFIWINFGIFVSIKNCWKLFSTRNKERAREIYNEEKIKLIDTFLLQNSINKGKYIERNYNGLLDFLNDNERKQIFFVPHIIGKFNSNDLQKICKSSKENIIFKQDFLKFTDYISALISIVKMGNIKKHHVLLKEFDITPIINEEISIKKYTVLSGLLNFHFIKRLKTEKIDLDLVVNWFENQMTDKGFNLGVKTFYPKVNHIGYKGYIGEEDFNFYNNPIKFEVDKKLIPETLGVIGTGLISISKKYYNKQIVKVVPGFRHNDLWNYQHNFRENLDKKIILVSLPFFIDECLSILKLLFLVVKKNNIDATFHIKTHPTSNPQSLKKQINNMPINFLFVEGDFIQNLHNVSLVIGTGSTSCVESIALGIPVIIIGNQSNLTQNPIPTSVNNKIWKVAYTNYELKNYILHYLNLNQIQIEELLVIGKEVKDQYFDQANKKKTKLFLNLSN